VRKLEGEVDGAVRRNRGYEEQLAMTVA